MTIEESFIELYSFNQKIYSEIEIELQIKRKIVQELYASTRYRTEYIQNIRDKFKNQRKQDFADFKQFFQWYEGQEQKCGYCEISQDDLYLIFQEEKILPLNDAIKRASGTLEIERRDSKQNSYGEKNIILACPLCNNAKSNLVDEDDWKNFFVEPMKKYYEKLLSKCNKNEEN